MVEETIKSIRETENKADQIVKEAEQESKRILKTAKEEAKQAADKLIDEAKSDALKNSKSGKERRRSYAGTGGGRNAQRSRTDEKGGS